MEVLTAGKFRFGNFEMDCARRSLTRSGDTVAVYSKAFDLLRHLVENRGTVLSKDELLERVWPGQFVEENNLTVQISALRKMFGERKGARTFIATVPGKGYSFVADVETLDGESEIVIENRSFSRITVEREIGTAENASTSTARAEAVVGETSSATRSHPTRQHRFAIVSLAVGALIVMAIGAYLTQSRLSVRSVAPFVKHNVRQLTTNGRVGSAALSPDGKLFAYTIDDLGRKSLWLGYVEGGNHLLLRESVETSYRGLAFSPDGSHLYFSITDDDHPKGALFKMPVSGGAKTEVLDGIGLFSLSPDGLQIAFSQRDEKGKGDHIRVTDLSSAGSRDIAYFPEENAYLTGSVSWSLDGRRLALSAAEDGKLASDDIVIIDIATGAADKVGFTGVREITKTSWLRDGSGLVITALETSAQASVPQYQLWHVAIPGGALSRISSDRGNYGASWHNDAGVTLSTSASADRLLAVEHRQFTNVWVAPWNDLSSARQVTHGSFGKYDGLWGVDWTPDGKIIYTTSDTQSQFLSQMNADGSGQKPLTPAGRIDSQPVISADGRYIYYHSNRASEMDIWRSDVDGTNPKQLTFGGKSFHPAPSPDGRWLYYKSYLSGIGELCRVPVDGGDPECLNDKPTSWGSFSPDGKYFAAAYTTDKARLAIWSAETLEIIRQLELPKTGTLYMGSHWTPDSRSVVFRDRNQGYWMQPIDGGAATQMEGLPREKLYNFAFSRDGKYFAYVRGEEIRDVILLENAAE